MKLFFMRILTWCMFCSRIYYVWSRIYQWLFERKWKRVEIPPLQTFCEIENLTGSIKWVKDGWRTLGDAISTPQAAYGRHLKGKGSDCDDISILAALCLERARRNGSLNKPVTEVGLLTCPWIKLSTDKVGGHNVCVFAYRERGQERWAYISNWFNGKIKWRFHSKQAIVDDMTYEHAQPTGWGFAQVTLNRLKLKLKLTEFHWK